MANVWPGMYHHLATATKMIPALVSQFISLDQGYVTGHHHCAARSVNAWSFTVKIQPTFADVLNDRDYVLLLFATPYQCVTFAGTANGLAVLILV